MQALENLLKGRYERTNLDVTKCYEKIQKVGGVETITYVGRFVKAYRMGSGDGMTAHWEFDDNGKVVTVDDNMWGSIGGQELAGFRVVSPPTTVQSIKYDRISCVNGFD